MPRRRIGLIGRRLVAVLLALVGFVLACVAHQDDPMAAALLWATAVVGVVIFNDHMHTKTPSSFFDAVLGGTIALGVGSVLLLASGLFPVGWVSTLALAAVWRTAWTVPTLDVQATHRLVEQMVVETWRAHPGFVVSIERRKDPRGSALVGFIPITRAVARQSAAHWRCVEVFQSPFALPVLFGPDAYGPYEMTEYVSPRLATVVDVGALRVLDTDTPIWSLPDSAHGRLAFEARLRAAT